VDQAAEPDWHSEWLEAAQSAASARKRFWRSQQRLSAETRLVFLAGDSIFNGGADPATFRVVRLFNWLSAKAGQHWQAVILGGEDADLVHGAMGILGPKPGDLAVLQDSGLRPANPLGVRALWTGRALLLKEFGIEIALMTAACARGCKPEFDWNLKPSAESVSANDAIRDVARSMGLDCLDFQEISNLFSASDLFSNDGVHLSPLGNTMLASALLAFASGQPVKAAQISSLCQHTNLVAASDVLKTIAAGAVVAAGYRQQVV
jgi:hypothetical protein